MLPPVSDLALTNSFEKHLSNARAFLKLTLLLTGVVVFGYAFFGKSLILALHEGRTIGYLNEIVAQLKMRNSQYADPSFFFNQINGLVIRGSLILSLVQGIFASLLWLFPNVLRSFIYEESHPLNLSLFRIAFFFMFMLNVTGSEERILWYSTLPADLYVAPPGWGGLLELMPINLETASTALMLLRVAIVFAFIGLFSRTSAWIVAILGIYVLGIPQMFGKVNHYHHIIWFAAILGSSRCGDMLSIDSLIRAFRQGRDALPSRPVTSRYYALPLKITWLLMGLIYFFPGFWKLTYSGTAWIFSENLKYKMYATWASLGADPPFFRLDLYPFLYQGAAIFTILFELAFIFLILVPRLRLLAAFGGLFFHNMTRIFLYIPFESLQFCYVALFN